MTDECRNCGAKPGDLHDPFCASELCPFCGDFISTCDCIFEVLHLNDDERQLVEEFEDDSVEPLKSICERWSASVEAKGRIPYGASA